MNGTNLYLLLVDVETDVEASHYDEPLYFACHIENHLRSPGAYERRNGSCEVFEAPTEEANVDCPEVFGYSW